MERSAANAAVVAAPAVAADEDADTPTLFARQLVWSRIEALENFDRQLSKMDDLIAKLAELNQFVLNQVQYDSSDVNSVAASKKLSQPPSQVTFSFYLNKIIGLLKQ